jgi:hypothetical protein
MKMISLPTLSAVMAAGIASVAATGGAHAVTPFDGSWNVQIITQRGACDPSSGFGVEIHDGIISGSGGVPVNGRVSKSGAVSVSVASGDRSASGSGHLSARSGGGTWHGVGGSGACSGRWSAGRR